MPSMLSNIISRQKIDTPPTNINMPQSLTSLPAELLAQIMCECPDIKTVLSLASTNRWATQVWHDHTIAIACAVFSFTRAELLGFLELAKLEASPPEEIQDSMTDQTPQASSTVQHASNHTIAPIRESRTEPALQQLRIGQLTRALATQSRIQECIENVDLNAAVRTHLFWIERSAFAIRVVQEVFETQDKAEAMRDTMNSPIPDETDPKCVENPLYLDEPSDLNPTFLLIRAFAVGYDHPSILPAVYAAMRDLSYDDLDDLFDVSRVIQKECDQHWDHIGIKRQEGEPTCWELRVDSHENITYLPRSWSFATYMVQIEMGWRPEPAKYGTYPDEEKEVRYNYSVLCEYFGHDRFKVMLGGGDKLPWTEERHVVRELFWEKEAVRDPAEYQQRMASLQS